MVSVGGAGIAVDLATATASPPVRDDIVSALRMRDERVLVFGFERPNLHLSVVRSPDERSAEEALLEGVASMPGTGLVYVATRARAEERFDVRDANCRFAELIARVAR